MAWVQGHRVRKRIEIVGQCFRHTQSCGPYVYTNVQWMKNSKILTFLPSSYNRAPPHCVVYLHVWKNYNAPTTINGYNIGQQRKLSTWRTDPAEGWSRNVGFRTFVVPLRHASFDVPRTARKPRKKLKNTTALSLSYPSILPPPLLGPSGRILPRRRQ